jgi:hypothetical protein
MECHVGISLNRTKTRVRVMDTHCVLNELLVVAIAAA